MSQRPAERSAQYSPEPPARPGLRPAAPVRILILPGAAILLGLTSLGLPLTILPLQVTFTLGFGPVVAGWVLATEAFTTLALRVWVGRLADRQGARYASQVGLFAASASGLLYLLSATLPNTPTSALAFILLGRIAMGVGQGLIFTGGGAWAVALLGPGGAGKAISLIGIAMFAGIAVGTALGGASAAMAREVTAATGFHISGFTLAACLTLVAPLLGWLTTVRAPAGVPFHQEIAPASLTRVLGAIWRSGLGFALASIGYSSVTSFVVILFATKGWEGRGFALFTFVGCFVATRALLGNFTDRARGPGAICAALVVQAAGLLTLWAANQGWMGIVGAALCGMGSSVTYPLLALPAIRGVPASQTALAIGLFDASFDVATIIAPPACGLLAATYGYSAIFLLAGLAVLLAIIPARAAWRGYSA